ncbi:MAG: hypothetical protein RLZZ290_21 [Pseudomonadota bacterium]|jgi:hypothetical protein
MQLRLVEAGEGTLIDASEVSWVIPVEQADLHQWDARGLVGMARGVPVWVEKPLEHARWLVLLRPNGDIYPGRLARDIDWIDS